jgi:hypothetical protein
MKAFSLELLTKNGLGLDAVANRWHLFRTRQCATNKCSTSTG